MNSKAKLAIIFLILANIIWGAAFPIYKLTLEVIPPFTFVLLRFLLGALILFPFVYKDLKVKLRDGVTLILLSILGITLTISFLNFGLKLSSSINAPIILSASPIFLIIGGFFYLKEKLKTKVVLGTLVSFLGVMTIVLLPVLKEGLDGSITGNLFLVFATFFSVIHALLLKKILPKYNPMSIAFWSFIIGSLPMIPFFMTDLNQTQWISKLNNEIILGLLFSVVVATVIAHSLFTFGIKYIKASEIGIFSYIDPVATIVVAYYLLHEHITVPYLIGAFLVFVGIFIAQGRIHYHPLHKLLN
ncbi:MAG: DMT family transporter [Candidatus Levybacteria bacterium]|nr:DMT family transporter [Candidatus Levybacteria bacterium]